MFQHWHHRHDSREATSPHLTLTGRIIRHDCCSSVRRHTKFHPQCIEKWPKGLHSRQNITTITSSIRERLYSETKPRLSLLWTLINKGVKGNELANRKAKSATRQLSVTTKIFLHSPKLLLSALQSSLISKWDIEWVNKKKGQLTKQFSLSILDAEIIPKVIIQHISNHNSHTNRSL